MSGWRSLWLVALVIVIVLAAPPAAQADDSLAAARELYAAAAYDDALAMLDRLQTTPSAVPDVGRTVALYRAFCLFALGRTADAEHAVETVVTMAPSYQPTDADTSPRMLALFSDVRRRTLPGIIQQKYTLARAAFDRKEFAAAAEGFERVLNMLDDPDLRTVSTLSDLRTIAAGFRDLSASAVAPPAPAPAPPPAAAASPPSAPEPAPANAPAKAPVAPRVYGADDLNVVPPGIVRQVMPSFRYKSTAVGGHLTVAVVIDERGAVEGVNMIVLLDPEFDRMLQDAAWTWQYKPAMLGGMPVKYRKVIQVNVSPK